jgi:hypothetical protein
MVYFYYTLHSKKFENSKDDLYNSLMYEILLYSLAASGVLSSNLILPL